MADHRKKAEQKIIHVFNIYSTKFDTSIRLLHKIILPTVNKSNCVLFQIQT